VTLKNYMNMLVNFCLSTVTGTATRQRTSITKFDCVHLSISTSETDGLAMFVPSLDQTDHRTSDHVIFFYGVM
jgi:hypothetical protein